MRPDIRNCEALSPAEPTVIGGSLNRRILLTQITHSVDRIARQYQHEVPNCRVSMISGLQLLRYRPGGFYTQHHDACYELPRILTCLVVLNDDFQGGSFSFFDNRIQIRPEPRQAIVFPSNFLYQHSLNPVTAGTRYALVAWLS